MGNCGKAAILAFLITVLIFIAIALCSCDQHIADGKVTEHIKNGEVVKRIYECHLGHTAVATESELRKVNFATPSGWTFVLDGFSKNNDSLEFEWDNVTQSFKFKSDDN